MNPHTITSILVLTPVFKEGPGMIEKFRVLMTAVARELGARGIACRHYFLDDGAQHLPEDAPRLVTHETNQGVATTLVEGYEAALKLRSRPDMILKIDVQEHPPSMIPVVIEHLDHTEVDALFLPVVYTLKDHPRMPMRKVTQLINQFQDALSPMDPDMIQLLYNQEFPVGFQAYRTETLAKITPKLRQALGQFEDMHSAPATWGFDLLAILFTAKQFPGRIDCLFGGWMEPWKENRPQKKIDEQRQKNSQMLALACEMGVPVCTPKT